MKNTKIIIALFLVSTLGITFNATQVSRVVAQSEEEENWVNPFENGGSTGSSIDWLHLSYCTVYETITCLGGGEWQYSFAFKNTDTCSLWNLVIYTTFQTTDHTSFTKAFWRNLVSAVPGEVNTEYDARNLDPDIKWFNAAYSEGAYNAWSPILVNEEVSGFSFKANVYDPSPKHYSYECVSNWAPVNYHVTAVGETVVEVVPCPPVPLFSDILAILPLGIVAGAVVIRRRRKA